MAELTIQLREYIGESQFNWDTLDMEWATSAEDVRLQVEMARAVGELTGICLEIGRCYGGSTHQGREIYAYLQSLNLPIRTRILAFAGSMGTVIPLAGDVVEMEASAQLLVHGPSGYAEGTEAEMTSGLDHLTKEKQALRDIYVARTGQPLAVVEEWMSKDTFFTAAEALAAGLVTKVLPLRPRTAAAAPVSTATARATRARYAGIVARAERRPAAPPIPPATTPAAPRAKAPQPQVPMAKPAVKSAPTAAATAAQTKANQAAVAAFAKTLGVKVKMEGETAAEETVAVATATVLADGAGTIYTDGPAAEGSAAYNDEALTQPTADGEYEAEDGTIMTIAGGVITTIVAAGTTAETGAPAADLTAAITAALKPLAERFDALEAKFNATVPATPRPRATGGQQADVKEAPRGLLAGASKA